MLIVTNVFTVLFLAAYCEGTCHDIDTKACELMQQQNQNLCQDPSLSSSACPRFCKLCPLVCHHCAASVLNFTDCNTNKTCQVGEQCMLHTLSSSRDGHHEYRMTCASVEMCDGTGLVPFGRRGLLSRDIQTHCCSDDMCNYPSVSVPVATPPPACNRDIEILIQESPDVSASSYSIQFIKDVVSHLVIGPSNNQVALATIDSSVNRQFSLNSYNTQAKFLQQLDRIKFNQRISTSGASEVYHYLTNELKPGSRHGERPSYKNAVLIIADHTAVPYKDHSHGDKNIELSSVIVINVGGASSADLSPLATDPSHVINVPDYASLKNSLTRVLQLICL